MKLSKLLQVLSLLGVGAVSSFAGESEGDAAVDTEASVRAAVAKALPYLADEGDIWIEEQKCSSCHQTGLLIWGNRLAESRGITIEAERLAGWTQWMREFQTGARTDAKGKPMPGINADGDLEGAGQLIMSGDFSPELEVEYGILHERLVAGQEESGFWKAGGQLPFQKRPTEETDRISTAWAVLAINALPGADDGARSRALAWLTNFEGEAGKSTEAAAVRLLLAHRFQTTAEQNTGLDELLSRRNDDGGWPWLTGDASDALATGQALYALAESGQADARREVIEKAWQFLAQTQRDDGSWRVLSTKEKTKEKSTEISNFFGSAWAVIGICRSLPESSK